MIAVILISAGIGYFISLPFASLLQGANYRLSTCFRRAKRWYLCCGAVAIPFCVFAVLIRLFCGKVTRVLFLTVIYVAMSAFLLILHKKMRLKLTVTNRLARLLLLSFLLYVGLFLPLYFVGWEDLWASFPPISPFVLALSSLLIAPFENKNNARYLKRAKKRLDETDAIKIGITGSYGKTSVKNDLEQLLSLKYKTLATPANYNTPLGIAKTMDLATGEEEALILEMGARKCGDVRELCDLVTPTIGVLTGIAPQHLETFGSLENVLEEKGVLANRISDRHTVYFNLTDPKVRELYDRREGAKIGVGFERADWIISQVQCSEEGTSFFLKRAGEGRKYSLSLFGQAAVVDFALACVVAIDLGVSQDAIEERARSISAAAHRFEVIKRGKVTIIDDSYNVNPVGASAALSSLALFSGARKIVYTCGIVELGAETERGNIALGEQIARVADLSVVGGKRYGDLVERGIRSLSPTHPVVRVNDTAEASATFAQLLKEGDVLLIMSDLPRDYLL